MCVYVTILSSVLREGGNVPCVGHRGLLVKCHWPGPRKSLQLMVQVQEIAEVSEKGSGSEGLILAERNRTYM